MLARPFSGGEGETYNNVTLFHEYIYLHYYSVDQQMYCCISEVTTVAVTAFKQGEHGFRLTICVFLHGDG